jgi:aminopeptidase N
MLKVLIGETAFRAGMDLYFDRYDGTAATIENFISCFAEVSHRDLAQFSRWYHQSGTPLVEAQTSYDAEKQTFTLDLKQSCKPTPGQDHKEPFVIPIELGLVGADGAPIALQVGTEDSASAEELARGVLELSTPERRVTFCNVTTPPVASLLRGFSAPVRLSQSVKENELIALVAHDSDSFNRWQAAQTYATRLLLRSVDLVRSGGKPCEDEAFGAALYRAIESNIDDPAFAAQIVSLPSEADMAREIGENVDPDAIHAAKQALRAALGCQLAPILLQTYERLAPEGAYSPDAAAAGRRALRTACLDLYAAGFPQEGGALALRQFETAQTMTDEIAALGILTHVPGEAREHALDTFYQRHSTEPLVIDKWFILQATIPEDGTLARVKKLMEHPAFSLTNPNRVRSLIGAFASGNQTQFNAADGSGFHFLGEIVIGLDHANPQVAARLLAAFKSWRALESKRSALAEAALRRVAQVNDLSADVRDIAERSLA